MAYIKVDCREMHKVADHIDQYIARMEKSVTEMDDAICTVGADWKGADYRQVKNEWNEIKGPGSTTDNMKQLLKNYADSVREAAQLYKEAQSRAINRANNLCK